MAETRGSENVMPDITEVSEADTLSSAAEHDDGRADSGVSAAVLSRSVKGTRLSADSNGVVTVPVSLPVGTLITGTTFNVITSEQLPHFKPMLCVDSGFITGGPSAEELAPRSASERSWEETANMPVLPIRCKNTSAELHKHRFGSGGRGRCIKYAMEWYTPSEFEALCGRASSKDWKRSIRFGGCSIQALINEGILTPHATSCTCRACCDDQSAMGPVRLYTPYKRKKGKQKADEKKTKVKREDNNEAEIIHQTSNNSNSKEAWQTITESLEEAPDYHLLEAPEPTPEPPVVAATRLTTVTPEAPPDLTKVLKRLEDIGHSVAQLAGELKACVEDMRQVAAGQLERIERERGTTLLAAAVDTQVDAEHTIEETDAKNCANCNREASAECSLCRRTPYCSTYCQKKDWAAHQIECLRSVPAVHEQHQSIMLIVESQHQ